MTILNIKLLVNSVLITLLGFGSLASAAPMDKDRGGGNAVGKQLFDFYENQGTEKVNIREMAVYKSTLRPLLKQLDALTPELSIYLTESLETKAWYLESKDLSAAGCLNSTMIQAAQAIIACQSPFEIRISKAWFEEASAQSPQQAAALIMHELLVSKMMNHDSNITEESVRFLNRVFFSAELPSASDLQNLMNERRFALIQTRKELRASQVFIKKTVAKYCPKSSTKISMSEVFAIFREINSARRDDRYTSSQQSFLGKFVEKGEVYVDGDVYRESPKCSTYIQLAESM